ncbi:MAG: hypothetical protein ACHP9Y_06355, partial [Gammaproteobacteria bacterium]
GDILEILQQFHKSDIDSTHDTFGFARTGAAPALISEEIISGAAWHQALLADFTANQQISDQALDRWMVLIQKILISLTKINDAELKKAGNEKSIEMGNAILVRGNPFGTWYSALIEKRHFGSNANWAIGSENEIDYFLENDQDRVSAKIRIVPAAPYVNLASYHLSEIFLLGEVDFRYILQAKFLYQERYDFYCAQIKLGRHAVLQERLIGPPAAIHPLHKALDDSEILRGIRIHPASFTKNLLRVLMMSPNETPENFNLVPSSQQSTSDIWSYYDLVLADVDNGTYPVYSNKNKSVPPHFILCLNAMHQPGLESLDINILRDFLALNPLELALIWLRKLEDLQVDLPQLFNSDDAKHHYQTTSFPLGLLANPEAVEAVIVRSALLQMAIQDFLNINHELNDLTQTPWKLFENFCKRAKNLKSWSLAVKDWQFYSVEQSEDEKDSIKKRNLAAWSLVVSDWQFYQPEQPESGKDSTALYAKAFKDFPAKNGDLSLELAKQRLANLPHNTDTVKRTVDEGNVEDHLTGKTEIAPFVKPDNWNAFEPGVYPMDMALVKGQEF